MTPREKETYDFILGYYAQHSLPPSYRDITDALGLKSVSNAHRLVWQLQRAGHIAVLPQHSKRRSIVPNDRCPHCGQVRAA